jgi:hypothetical protein
MHPGEGPSQPRTPLKAVLWGRLQVNPVVSVSKPRKGRRRTVRPLSPAEVERA